MSAQDWAIGLAISAGITALFIGFWWLGNRMRDWADARISKAPWEPRPALRFGAMRILGEGWIRSLMRFTNRAAHLLWRAMLLIVYLSAVVIALPVAKNAPNKAAAFIIASLEGSRNNFIAYLPSLGRIVLIVIFLRIVLGLLRWFFDEIRKGKIVLRKFDRSWARQTFNLIRFAVVALGAIMIFPHLPGSGTTSFQGIAIFIGALISIGASSAVSNAVAGIVITYTKAFDRGERVKIADTVGDVLERSMFVTRIRTIKNEEIAIPNQLVLASHITNYSRDVKGHGVAVEIRIGLGYDVPWRKVHELLHDAASNTEGVMTDPKPRVYQSELGDFAVVYTLHAFTDKPTAMTGIRSDLLQRIQDNFAAAKVQIMSPDHVAWHQGQGALPPVPAAPAPEEPPQPDAP